MVCSYSMLILIVPDAYAKAPDHTDFFLSQPLYIYVPEMTSASPEIKLQPSIKSFVEEYLKKNGGMLEDIGQKNKSGFSTIEKIFTQYELPAELKYLAVVESKLKNTATSGAGAAGIWQLMPRTARMLGLKVNGKTDERRQLYKSSAAAAKYLEELYKKFDDWLLVIAAYNSGAGNVYKAIKRSGSRDFWKLQYFLPKETRMHVKKFIATHFYYEQKGSLVTLTKKESENYFRLLKDPLQEQPKKNQPEDSPVSPSSYFNWVLISYDGTKLYALARK